MTRQNGAIWPSTFNEDPDEPEHQHIESEKASVFRDLIICNDEKVI